MIEDLHVKYRPTSLDEVVGQPHIVSSLRTLFSQKKLPHAFLFQGPSGVGKTTLSRIIALELGCSPINILEVDAGKATGVDDMRQLTDELIYTAIGGKNKLKFVILDESHMLSKSAWNSLLKIIEEPPSHVYFSFCTTEPGKVPTTIQTRCHKYNLKDVMPDDIEQLLEAIADIEKIKLPENTLPLIASRSYGSPRRAIVMLSQCRGCKTIKEVMAVLEEPDEEKETIELCRLLLKSSTKWIDVIKLIRVLKEKNPESVRIQVCNYLTAVIVNKEGDASNETAGLLNMLQSFSRPYTQQTGFSELLLSIGEVFFAEKNE